MGSRSGASRGGALPFLPLALALLAGGGIGLAKTARDLTLALESPGWPTTPGRIVESRTRGSQGRRRAVLRYAYVVDEIPYESRRVAFMEGMFRLGAVNRVRTWPVDREMPVHYAPQDPGISVLLPGASPVGFTGGFAASGLFLWIGAAFTRSCLRSALGR